MPDDDVAILRETDNRCAGVGLLEPKPEGREGVVGGLPGGAPVGEDFGDRSRHTIATSPGGRSPLLHGLSRRGFRDACQVIAGSRGHDTLTG